MQDPHGGGGGSWWKSKEWRRKELGEEEWISLNTLSLRKTKIWQDYSISLKHKKGEKMGVFCLGMEERERVYIVVMKKIWIEGYLMRVDKGSKIIMNLDPILNFGENWCIKCRD